MSSKPLRPLVAATRNRDKLERLAQILGSRHDLLPLVGGVEIDEPDLDAFPPQAGDAMVSIATAKAVSASVAVQGAMTIATDGGLVIPALGDGWQAARTRRFAGPHATNRHRAAALLAVTSHLTGDDRRIYWREAVAIARDGGVLMTTSAESMPGWLASELAEGADDGQGFWITRLWRSNRDVRAPTRGGDEHWRRLAAIVGPYLDGSADSQAH